MTCTHIVPSAYSYTHTHIHTFIQHTHFIQHTRTYIHLSHTFIQHTHIHTLSNTYTNIQLEDTSLSQSHIEQDFAKNIQDLAERFAEEIEDLKTAISDMFGCVEDEIGGERAIRDLGSEKGRRELEEETAEVEVEVINAVKNFEVSVELLASSKSEPLNQVPVSYSWSLL